jgi:hypothetical protein
MLNYLPRTAEWYGMLLLFLAASAINPAFLIVPVVGFGYSAYYFISCASQVHLPKTLPSRMRTPWHIATSRLALTLLHLIEPAARYWGRARSGLVPWRGIRRPAHDSIPDPRPNGGFNGGFVRSLDLTQIVPGAVCKATLLRHTTEELKAMGCAVHWNPVTERWDMRVRRGALAQATSRVHIGRNGPGTQSVRLGIVVAPTAGFWLTILCLSVVLATGALGGHPAIAMMIGIGIGIMLVFSIREAGRMALAMAGAFHKSLHGLLAARTEP